MVAESRGRTDTSSERRQILSLVRLANSAIRPRRARSASLTFSMHDHIPSKTAFRVAMRRAVHQLLDEPKVLDDPFALPILGEQTASELRAAPAQFEKLGHYKPKSVRRRAQPTSPRISLPARVQRGVRGSVSCWARDSTLSRIAIASKHFT